GCHPRAASTLTRSCASSGTTRPRSRGCARTAPSRYGRRRLVCWRPMAPETSPDVQIVDAAGVTIAVITGACGGAELESLLEADVRIAGDTATFSSVGVRDPIRCARRLTRLLAEARAKEIMLGGRTASAGAALRLGLVTRVVPTPAIADAVRALCDELRALPP